MSKGWSILMFCTLFLFVSASSRLDAAKSPLDQGSLVVNGYGMLAEYNGEAYEGWFGEGTSIGALNLSLGSFLRRGLALGWQFSLLKASQDQYEFKSFAFGPRVTYYFRQGRAGDDVVGSGFPYLSFCYLYGGLMAGAAQRVRSLSAQSMATPAFISYQCRPYLHGDSWDRRNYRFNTQP